LGADGIELDVHATEDGRFVVYHDSDLPDEGPLRDLPSTKVRQHVLSNGERIPYLEEVLEEIRDLSLWIEVKQLDATWDHQLLSLINDGSHPERCAVHSFDHRIILRLGRLFPSLQRGLLSTSYLVDPLGPLATAGANTLWQEWQLIDQELVDLIHRSGRRIIAWTINDADVGQRLTELGVDGLCGNYPDRLSWHKPSHPD
jgi:glycerophosphoryl diester phosphodiesterase